MKANRTNIGRSLCMLILCSLLVIFLCCGCGADQKATGAAGEQDPPTEENNEKNLIAMAKISIQSAALEKDETCNDLYPAVYRGIEELKLSGKTEDEAIEKVKQNRITNQALYMYAEAQNLSVAKEEVDTQIKQTIKSLESADNGTEIKEAYKKAGTTFEEMLWSDRAIYEKNILNDKLYQKANALLEKEGHKSQRQDENWKFFKQDVVSGYMKSQDYKIMKQQLEEAIAYYKAHNPT